MKDKVGIANMSSTQMSNGPASKESALSVDDRALKVRKPYTITKQREKWTDEEHNKFLEALKLYGRAWRRIEEHISTKTAVQIRSHAQKFFTKVVRESPVDAATANAIEIPPPRPKRKPTHPYPRKLRNPSIKGIQVPSCRGWSALPIPSVSEQDHRSPTSVFSVFGSDTTGSSGSNSPNGYTSPLSLASGTNQVELLNERESGCQFGSSSSDKHGSSAEGSAKLNPEDSSATELDSGLDDTSSKDGSLKQTQGTSLKLFGKIVLITDSQKLSSSGFGNAVQCCKSLPTDNVDTCQNSIADQPMIQTPWNSWPVGMPPMFFSSTLTVNQANPGEAATFPLPMWWPMYGTPPLPNVEMPHLFVEASTRKSPKEIACSGSDTSSGSEVVDSQLAVRSNKGTELEPALCLKPSATSAFQIPKVRDRKPSRGFAPYKRCVEKEEKHSQLACEANDDQRLQLCL